MAKTVRERLLSKCAHADIGCWEWTGSLNAATGYGQFWLDGTTALAHRAAYDLLIGPIPEGHWVDHLCGNRACVRPDHLEAVTASENAKRAKASPACPNGHVRTEASTYIDRRGRGHCRPCRVAAQARYRARGG